jgi:hypothetical protein
MRRVSGCLIAVLGGAVAAVALPLHAAGFVQSAAPPARPHATLVVGAVTAVSGPSVTVKTDAGPTQTVTVADRAKILKAQPGSKSIAGATADTLSDLVVGDRVLLATHPSPDSATPMATTVVIMKQADIARMQQQEAEAWREHSVGGIVKAVDPAAGTLTVAAQLHTLTVHTQASTMIRRYAADSIQYADAKPATLDQIHPGDQVRVLGQRSADATIEAQKIVAGSFQNIAGTVVHTDPAANTVTVMNASTKKPVTVRITPETQMHKLPETMANQLAARFRAAAAHGGANGHAPQPRVGVGPRPAGSPPTGGGVAAGRQHLTLAQMLQQTPAVSLKELHKGDALMIVASQDATPAATAFTLLAGVGPILRASPAGNGSMFSATWNLNGQGGGGGMGGGGMGGGQPGGAGGGGGPRP